MEDLDLNINNYSLEELLNLFHLDYNFGENELKMSKKMALKTHPDKSGLSMKYFIFFVKAYKSLSNVYYFRQKRKSDAPDEYDAPTNKQNAALLHSLEEKSVEEFNSWFNKMFDKVKIHDNEMDAGYEEWYKNNDVVSPRKNITMSDFGREFEKTKQQCKSVVIHKGVQDTDYSSGGYSLSRNKPKQYSSDIFSKLPYEDLKKAHTETVVPVTREDFDNIPKFSSVDSFIQHREKQATDPLSLQQSKKYLHERTQNENKESMLRAYSLIKMDEAVEKSNQEWWKNFKILKN